MDLRFSYERIRDEISRADFEFLDSSSQLVKDIKARMHGHVDRIEELEKQKKDIDRCIKAERMMLKDLAESWDV